MKMSVVVPAQPTADVGVTAISATTGAFVVSLAVNGSIFPVPLADRPMLVSLLVHV